MCFLVSDCNLNSHKLNHYWTENGTNTHKEQTMVAWEIENTQTDTVQLLKGISSMPKSRSGTSPATSSHSIGLYWTGDPLIPKLSPYGLSNCWQPAETQQFVVKLVKIFLNLLVLCLYACVLLICSALSSQVTLQNKLSEVLIEGICIAVAQEGRKTCISKGEGPFTFQLFLKFLHLQPLHSFVV